MAQSIRSIHFTDEQPADAQAVEQVYADNLPAGGGAPDGGSVTPASLKGYDAGTGHGKVPQVKTDGSGFDFVAMPAAFSGSYNDLTNKPTIPSAYTLPAATTAALGGVKRAEAIAPLASDADAAAVIAKVNEILTKGKAAGFFLS